MGESAPCLMRSIPQPLFASCELKEGDRFRALTTSISFGRFMNEPLDWEKWSSFSHNRILEDVQKHSRPGAVAEKKAFFEAYYKNLAPKKGPKPPKKENKPPNIPNTDENKSSDRRVEPVIPSNEDIYLPSITNQVSSGTGDVDDIISTTCHMDDGKTLTELTENISSPCTNPDSSNRGAKPETASSKDGSLPSTNLVHSDIKNTDDKYDIIPSASAVEFVKSGSDIVTLHVGDVKDGVSSNKGLEPEMQSNEDVGLPRTNIVFSENKIVDDMTACSRRSEQEKTSSKNVPSKKILIHVEKNKKRQFKDKLSARTETGISWVRSSSREAARELMKKKNSVLQSLNLSNKFTDSQNKYLKLKTSSKPKEKPVQQAQTRVSSVNGVKKNSQLLPRPENKRHSEALTASTKKPRSTTVFSSFSFRSDERAAKRKEFFQKLEEKGSTNKIAKTQLQPKPKLKEKGRSVDRKLPWSSTILEAKTRTSEKKVASNIIPKVPPKHGKKNFIEINKKNLISSMASFSSKKP